MAQPESEAGIAEDQWMAHSFSSSLTITNDQCDNSKQRSRKYCFTQRRLVFFRPSADGCQPLTTGESNLLCISEHTHTQPRYIYTTRLGSYDETSQFGEAVK